MNCPEVDVWSYTDPIVQPQQLIDIDSWKGYYDSRETQKMIKNELQIDSGRYYTGFVKIGTKKIIQLEKENEAISNSLNGGRLYGAKNEDYAIICKYAGNIITNDRRQPLVYIENEYNWNNALLIDIILKSQNDGSRKLLFNNVKLSAAGKFNFEFSSSGKLILFHGYESDNYFSYEIATGVIRNLTKNLHVSFIKGSDASMPREYFSSTDVAIAWLGYDHVLVYDHYHDIWELDLMGIKKAKNITNGYARRHPNISWNAIGGRVRGSLANKVINNSSKILLLATDNTTKDLEIFVKDISLDGDPIGMGSGPYSYNIYILNSKNKLTDNKIGYVFQRESFKEPPRLFFTRDFKNIIPIYDLPTEKTIGIDQEIVSWKTIDGTIGNGILFKPKNFDPQKKYPVIINYYEAVRNYNKFMAHDELGTSSNEGGALTYPSMISCLLSQGYLFFNPDITYEVGDPGKSILNNVVSGAQYLSSWPFVDGKHIGIAGHSYGGYETNFLVSHTDIFAAAFSGSGVADYMSYYGTEDLDFGGYSYLAGSETGQNRLGVTPWDRPDIYLKNSPIFFADRITTPLLLMSNRKDYRVPRNQGIELFMALRRLGKRVWLLQYDNGDHGVTAEKDANDIGIRMMQFFNHYLKGEPAPVWMTRGIPAQLKGRTLGYEYDSTMKTPGPGLLMENEGALTPQQKELLKHKTTVNNEGRIVDVSADKTKKLKSKTNK